MMNMESATPSPNRTDISFEKAFRTVHEHIVEIMPKIRREPTGCLRAPFLTVTWGACYAGVYGWDDHFMTLRFAADGKIEELKNYLTNMLSSQREDGYIPNIYNDKGPTRLAFHAQPFLAQNAAVYLSLGGEEDFVRGLFPKFTAYLDYYYKAMHWEKGLCCWPETYMSGIDNEISGTLYPINTMLAADLNAYLYLECKAMKYLADRLGLPAGENEPRAAALAEAVNTYLWDEEYGFYGNYNTQSGAVQLALFRGRPDGVGKYSFLSGVAIPVLYAGLASPERAERMVRGYLMDPKHFLSDYGFRSLSRSSEYYNNAVWGNPPRFGNPARLTNSNWQGPVWVVQNYQAILGLLRYGYRDEARLVTERLIRALAAGIEKYGFMRENMDAETGEPLYADKFASWNLLADLLPDFVEGKPPFRNFPWE